MVKLVEIHKEIVDIWKFRMVVWAFVTSIFKMRYKKSALGVIWSLLGPAMNYLVIGIVFSFFSRIQMENFFVFMFSGVVIYNLMASIINQGPGALIGSENYIKKIYLPKSIFVLNIVFLELINFCFGLLALIILGFIFKKLHINVYFLFLPVPIFFALLLSFGLNAFLSTISVFFRDFVHITPIIMQAMFFLTPILYPLNTAPERFRPILYFNPLYHVVECFRYPVFNNSLPPIQSVITMAISSTSIFILGFLFLKSYDNRIVFRL